MRKGYNRYFIIFQEEDKGYGIAIDKQPTGYAKIEVRNGKCKITVYAQNIKQEKGPYHFCMIDADKNPADVVKLGEVRIDEIGTGETFWEYNEDNVGGSGQSVEKFNVAVLLADETALLAPLSGFAGKGRISWKDKLVANAAMEDNMRNTENVIEDTMPVFSPEEELDEEAIRFKEYEKQMKEEADRMNELVQQELERGKHSSSHEHISHGICEHDHEACKKHEDFEMDEYLEDKHSSHDHNGCHEHLCKQEKDEHKKAGHHGKKKETYADTFHSLLEEFEEITDEFTCHHMDNTRWWKIPARYDERMIDEKHYPFMCTIFHLSMAYPHIDYVKYFYKRGYYYFGIKYDDDQEVKYLMYGIPGHNNIREQPYMGMTGFNKWVGETGEMGAWVMFYNPRTGNFMIEKNR